MNRIVIIGNGVDLAFGLKTRYEDFLVKLIKDNINKASRDNTNGYKSVVHNLFSVALEADSGIDYDAINACTNLSDLPKFGVVFPLKNNYFKGGDSSFVLDSSLKSKSRSNQSRISILSDSDFFLGLLAEKEKNWTDIERHYFQTLSFYVDEYEKDINRRFPKIEVVAQIKSKLLQNIGRLNKDFEDLKKELVNYLKSMNENVKENSSLQKMLFENLVHNNLLKYESDTTEYRYKYKFSLHDNVKVGRVIFLNFNYTNTISIALMKLGNVFEGVELLEIPIHGNIISPETIIFGYGDEANRQYEALEILDEDEFKIHFKASHYHGTDYYSKLLYYLDDRPFEVAVIGHSLGYSDKLLLQTIFEHKNCFFIHLCHTGGNSHFRKRMALSKHFNSKNLMLEKLLEENPKLEFKRNPDSTK